MRDQSDFKRYRPYFLDKTNVDTFSGSPNGRIVNTKELPSFSQDCEWGRLDYKFTHFDIIYTAYDKNGKVIISEALEFPIEGEKDTTKTVAVVVKKVATLVERLHQ